MEGTTRGVHLLHLYKLQVGATGRTEINTREISIRSPTLLEASSKHDCHHRDTHVLHSPDSSLVAEDRVLTPETKFTTAAFVRLEIMKGRVRPSNGSTTPQVSEWMTGQWHFPHWMNFLYGKKLRPLQSLLCSQIDWLNPLGFSVPSLPWSAVHRFFTLT